ncbi:hypothetical protein ASPZODRAFT_2129235 [Penicilliopsis zonata CBS 506.65]|uniref:Tat pathway signal sequence n=1 Tax=Penicilliopsis zonata CBS 506.65 TaxID=1073090 RepID=A0A1L9S4B0_9EURO|nr:hypothetical protein ASPZODRAFT_2129235 [Penicilliopsis zonata CBS 506.65]OJJ42007.1 hypothetical protein ASPZODRAFT_2129235 [Penicilliopsis zonata CBS 506.65]
MSTSPMIYQIGDTELLEQFVDPVSNPKIAIRRLQKALFIHRALVIILGVFCIAQYYLSKPPGSNLEHPPVFSPAQQEISYRTVVFTSGFGSGRTIYQGPPSPERDAAWNELYGFGVSRIPKSDAAQLVNRTVPIPDDPGYYVVSLNVFHQLHCLNMLRKRIWSKEDFPADHELMGMEHIEHCIDALRQSLMCSADITPLPWAWDAVAHQAKEVAETAHTCRDFDRIRQWAIDRRIKYFDRTLFVPDELAAH